VRVQKPGIVGRRHFVSGNMKEGDPKALYIYVYEVRSASSDQAFAQYAKALVAEVEVAPLPAVLPF
jgi:hypothetical protein